MADHSHVEAEAAKAYDAGDYQTALHIWGEEAAKGNPKAQESLGYMHAAGKGTPQDYRESVRWYRMAAEQGSTSALHSLGKIYYEGLGVQKSVENAYAYFLVSGANGNRAAKEKQRMVLKEMSPEQIEKAMRITFDLLQKISE
jgi:TPR repeat protein